MSTTQFNIVTAAPVARVTVKTSEYQDALKALPIGSGYALEVKQNDKGETIDNGGKFRRALSALQSANANHSSGTPFAQLHLGKATSETGVLTMYLLPGIGSRTKPKGTAA